MKKMMKSKQKLQEPAQLNPNWAQLLQKLNTTGNPRRVSKKKDDEMPQSVLGKRKEMSVEEPVTQKPNPLVPTSTDSSLTNVLAMDCEMVGVGPLGNKNALGRVTLVNKWGNVVYDEFVRPIDHVVNFRTEISGIRPSDLRKAKNFSVVQKTVAEMMKGRIVVGHALHNDLKALLLSHPKNDIRDTSEYQPLLKDGQKRGLRHLADEILGVEIQNGEHCPIEDARAAMALYQKYRKQWEKSSKHYVRLQKKQKKRGNKRKRPHGDGEKS